MCDGEKKVKEEGEKKKRKERKVKLKIGTVKVVGEGLADPKRKKNHHATSQTVDK